MSHLKTELRSLQRCNLVTRGYGFDLTRFCTGCWAKLGRIINRGKTCSSCKKKVCKTCRYWETANRWICVTCQRRKDSRPNSWRRKSNFGNSCGRCVSWTNGTYSSKMTDWSLYGKGTILPNLMDNSESPFFTPDSNFEGDRKHMFPNLRAERKNSTTDITEIVVQSYEEPDQNLNRIDCNFDNADILSIEMPSEVISGRRNYKQNALKFDYNDPVQRWLLACYSNENPTAILDKQSAEEYLPSFNSTSIRSSKKILGRSKQKMPLEQPLLSALDESQCKAMTLSEQKSVFSVSASTPSNCKIGDQRSSTKNLYFSIDSHKDNSSRDYFKKGGRNASKNNFSATGENNYTAQVDLPPEKTLTFDTCVKNVPSILPPSHVQNTPRCFIRNDLRGRLSVRESRDVSRMKVHNLHSCHMYLPKHNLCEKRPPRLRGRSVSLPSQLLNLDNDLEVWNYGFVENRVRKLEEDLTRNLDDQCIFTKDLDIHSLLSLDLDRMAPDRDDYRLVYLSSSATSQDSNFDSYYTDCTGTLSQDQWIYEPTKEDNQLNGTLTSSIDWDMSDESSIDVNDGDSEDDDTLGNIVAPISNKHPAEFKFAYDWLKDWQDIQNVSQNDFGNERIQIQVPNIFCFDIVCDKVKRVMEEMDDQKNKNDDSPLNFFNEILNRSTRLQTDNLYNSTGLLFNNLCKSILSIHLQKTNAHFYLNEEDEIAEFNGINTRIYRKEQTLENKILMIFDSKPALSENEHSNNTFMKLPFNVDSERNVSFQTINRGYANKKLASMRNLNYQKLSLTKDKSLNTQSYKTDNYPVRKSQKMHVTYQSILLYFTTQKIQTSELAISHKCFIKDYSFKTDIFENLPTANTKLEVLLFIRKETLEISHFDSNNRMVNEWSNVIEQIEQDDLKFKLDLHYIRNIPLWANRFFLENNSETHFDLLPENLVSMKGKWGVKLNHMTTTEVPAYDEPNEMNCSDIWTAGVFPACPMMKKFSTSGLTVRHLLNEANKIVKFTAPEKIVTASFVNLNMKTPNSFAGQPHWPSCNTKVQSSNDKIENVFSGANYSGLPTLPYPLLEDGCVCSCIHCHGTRLAVTPIQDDYNILCRRSVSAIDWNDSTRAISNYNCITNRVGKGIIQLNATSITAGLVPHHCCSLNSTTAEESTERCARTDALSTIENSSDFEEFIERLWEATVKSSTSITGFDEDRTENENLLSVSLDDFAAGVPSDTNKTIFQPNGEGFGIISNNNNGNPCNSSIEENAQSAGTADLGGDNHFRMNPDFPIESLVKKRIRDYNQLVALKSSSFSSSTMKEKCIDKIQKNKDSLDSKELNPGSNNASNSKLLFTGSYFSAEEICMPDNKNDSENYSPYFTPLLETTAPKTTSTFFDESKINSSASTTEKNFNSLEDHLNSSFVKKTLKSSLLKEASNSSFVRESIQNNEGKSCFETEENIGISQRIETLNTINLRREIPNVVWESTTCENPPQEIGVIDTHATSETGSAAFVEFFSCSTTTCESCEARLRQNSAITVPAVQQAAKREGSSSLPASATGAGPVPFSTTSETVTSRRCCEDLDKASAETWLPNPQFDLFCDNSGDCELDYTYNGEKANSDYQHVDVCTVSADTLTSAERCHSGYCSGFSDVVNNGLSFNFSEQDMSDCDDPPLKTRGAKIAELKKFFDSCGNNPTRFRASNQKDSLSVTDGFTGNEHNNDSVKREGDSQLKFTMSVNSQLKITDEGDRSVDNRDNPDHATILCAKTDNKTRHRNLDANNCFTNGGDSELKNTAKAFSELKNSDVLPTNSDKSMLLDEYHGSKELNFKQSFEIKNEMSTSTNGTLWKDVDIGLNHKNASLWSSDLQNVNGVSLVNINYEYNDISTLLTPPSESAFTESTLSSNVSSDPFCVSTSELNNLIAVSRAELSKTVESPLLPPKSTLENYFTYAFEDSKPNRKLPPSHTWHSEVHASENSNIESKNMNHDAESNFTHVETSKKRPEPDFIEHSNSCYECDVDEITFDDLDDAALSDSSEEDSRYHSSPPNNHHLPAYALHTIIEESCEESEKDSRSATPTNQESASKLERYFSWDIVNEAKMDNKKVDSDSSTIYSDSLSDVSGSLNGDASNEIEPSHLASSRLEKYFTSGLLGNENYFYPDDAEFLDDASVSDFEEENRHHKISRSALLNSLEILPVSTSDFVDQIADSDSDSMYRIEALNVDVVQQSPSDVNVSAENDILESSIDDTEKTNSFENSSSSLEPFKENEDSVDLETTDFNNETEIQITNGENSEVDQTILNNSNEFVMDKNSSTTNNTDIIESNVLNNNFEEQNSVNPNDIYNETTANLNIPDSNFCESEEKYSDLQPPEEYANMISKDELPSEKNCNEKRRELIHKVGIGEHFDEGAQAIMKKIISHLSESSLHPVENKSQMDYISAWKLLESEIERLMLTVSPISAFDNGSCNSSTFGSNNSDYGSDTIESTECVTTDEDDNLEIKSKIETGKSPGFFNLSKIQKPNDNSFSKLNISSETVDIWKKLLQSLKKDKLSLSHNPNCDEYTKARLYIRDQIISLMHTVTSGKTNSPLTERKNVLSDEECDILALLENPIIQDDIKQVFERSEKKLETLKEIVAEDSETQEFESLTIVDEGISIDSNENLYSDWETLSSCSTTEKPTGNIEPSTNYESINEKVYEPQQNVDIPSGSVNHEIELHHTSTESKSHIEKGDLSLIDPVSEACDGNVDETVTELKQESEDISKNSHAVTHFYREDPELQFSVYVDIELGDEITSITERKLLDVYPAESIDEKTKRASLHLWVSDDETIEHSTELNKDAKNGNIVQSINYTDHPSDLTTANPENPQRTTESDSLEIEKKCDSIVPPKVKNSSATHRDTGYYSFKSSDDSILSITESVTEFPESSIIRKLSLHKESLPHQDVRKCSAKPSGSVNILSLSTTNIPQNFSSPELKFSTLQPKSHTSKVSMNPRSPSSTVNRALTSYFSPSAVFKKLTTSKSNGSPTSESSVPSKYLKKYARSCSVDNESIYGATSMPHLYLGDSYSTNGVFADCDRDSSITLDDELEAKHSYSSCSQSVLSLGSHSASMTSVYSAAGGRHYGYVSVSGDVLFGLNYNQKSQMMEVFVKQCRNLAAVDPRRNKSDPYVKVYLLPDKTKSGKRKTKTKKNTLNPIFNELLRFPVLKHELESRTLWLSVWNSDIFGRNDFLGEITLSLGYRLLDSPTLRWYPLQERVESLTSPLNYKGDLFLALKYVPKDLSLEPRFRPAPVISVRGALHVLVKEARNISATRSNGTSDAFCKSYLLPDKSKNSKQKTPVVKKSRHPKWYYTVIYEDLSVEELKERSLELTLWDHDKITSNEFMGGIRLNTGTGLYHGVPVDWMDAFRDEASLWQAMLERPNMWVDGSLPLRATMQSRRS